MDFNIRNIFLGKSYTKGGGEYIPRPFKQPKLTIYLDQWSKFLCRLWLSYAKLRAIKIY